MGGGHQQPPDDAELYGKMLSPGDTEQGDKRAALAARGDAGSGEGGRPRRSQRGKRSSRRRSGPGGQSMSDPPSQTPERGV